MKTIKQLYDDLINNIDNIYPATTLVLGINNKQRFVSCQSLLDYIEKKYLKSSKPSHNSQTIQSAFKCSKCKKDLIPYHWISENERICKECRWFSKLIEKF